MTFSFEQLEALFLTCGLPAGAAEVAAGELMGAHGNPALFCQQVAQTVFNHTPVNRTAFLAASRASFLWASLEADIHPHGEPVERLRDRLAHLATV